MLQAQSKAESSLPISGAHVSSPPNQGAFDASASLRNRVYYFLKPALPAPLRMGVRRWFARRWREQVKETWPIMAQAAEKPEGWRGWPNGKKFCLVFTHDVEGRAGVRKCRELMQLEQRHGLRSSYNFIPEGPYRTPAHLREELTGCGFEVGIHDLKHDGRLFDSRVRFGARAAKINGYLADWNAVGFRSGFMLHNLDWLHDLNIQYDLSTFDTDPFEPQPQGRHTIFPFWVPFGEGKTPRPAVGQPEGEGYVEIPYTLPQDSTLFLLLKEKSPDIWMRKLDWIVQNGGMALVNIHPDYVDFSNGPGSSATYPVKFIEEFVSYIANKYRGEFWNPCPKDLASWFKSGQPDEIADREVEASPRSSKQALKGKRAAVLLYSFYPSDPRPRRAAEALVEAGMQVDLYCLRENEGEPREETVNGVRVYRLPIRNKRGNKLDYIFQYSRFLLRSFFFLARRSFRCHYDLVHVHNMPDALVFSALIPKLKGAAVILDLHDPMPELMRSIYELSENHFIVRLLRLLEKWSIGFSDLALTPNIAFKDLFVSRSCPASKMKIVMNSPQENIFVAPTRVERPIPSSAGEFRVMHHGSIVHRHGVDLLVRAMAEVRRAIPGAYLDIYGSETAFLLTVRELAAELGIAEAVRYHGAKTQQEIAQAILECNIGVVPNRRSSFTELNFPTRLFEYLAMGRPVIAPATKGILDYFQAGTLITFEPGDVKDLADKIVWAGTHPEQLAPLVERGRTIYQGHEWQGEKEGFLESVGSLLKARQPL